MNNRIVVLLAACVVLLGTSAVVGQTPKPIPVYPGAQLLVEQKEGEEAVCCDFITQDAFSKVLSFYEQQLKAKPLDTKALKAKYPQLREQIGMLEQEMGPGMQLRAFVVGEMDMGGVKTPFFFEVVSTPKGVTFSLDEETLGTRDQHFAAEWRKKTGTLTEEEQLAQEQGQPTPEDLAAQKEEDEREAQKMAACTREMVAQLAGLYDVIKTAPYTGSVCKGVGLSEGEMSYNFGFFYATNDDFMKVYNSYAAKLKPRDQADASQTQRVYIRQDNGEKSYWSFFGDGHVWRSAMFDAAEGVTVEVLELSERPDGSRKAFVNLEINSGNPAAEKLLPVYRKYHQ